MEVDNMQWQQQQRHTHARPLKLYLLCSGKGGEGAEEEEGRKQVTTPYRAGAPMVGGQRGQLHNQVLAE